MDIAIYGGSFNPPHIGHIEAAKTVLRLLAPDKLLIVPDNISPYREAESEEVTAEDRLALCRLAFGELPNTEVSEIELTHGGKSYTAETVESLRAQYPGATFTLVIGADKLAGFESWYRVETLARSCTVAVILRDEDENDEAERLCEELSRKLGTRFSLLPHIPVPVSSGEVRRRLALRLGSELLSPPVYGEIIRRRLYGAKPELCWLREQVTEHLKPSRIAHVAGCECEAVALAQQWGADPEAAAEAAILHDITKKLNLDEQLHLCRKYGIIPDSAEEKSADLLHSKTGAALSRELFGIPEEIYGAISWHTTGRADMTLLEKIVYLADTIEPTRTFGSVEELRELCREDIDRAMRFALEHCLEYLRVSNIEPHIHSVEALLYYQ